MMNYKIRAMCHEKPVNLVKQKTDRGNIIKNLISFYKMRSTTSQILMLPADNIWGGQDPTGLLDIFYLLIWFLNIGENVAVLP